MSEYQKDCYRAAKVAASGAQKAEAEGQWRMAKALWGTAGDRYHACGMRDVAEYARQKQADAAKLAA